jgi:hypothetical protein
MAGMRKGVAEAAKAAKVAEAAEAAGKQRGAGGGPAVKEGSMARAAIVRMLAMTALAAPAILVVTASRLRARAACSRPRR